MTDLFKQKQSYDNEGNLYVNSATQFLKATLTQALGGAASFIIPYMYDGNAATGCQISTGVTGDSWVRWEFTGKPRFKNVFCTVAHDGGDTREFWLHGSNDTLSWTEIATIGATSTDATQSMSAADVNWKYLRMKCTTLGNSTTIHVADIMGTT